MWKSGSAACLLRDGHQESNWPSAFREPSAPKIHRLAGGATTPLKGGDFMNKRQSQSRRFLFLAICVICAVGILLVLQNTDVTAGSQNKLQAQQNAFKVYQQKCLGCHDSVADPEKPGRTRDDWHLVIQVMHGYGLDLNIEESNQIIDLLYNLRKGMEREPG